MDILSLPASLDLKTAAELQQALLAKRGQPLQLDATHVERVGGLGLQVLLAARAAWDADGQDLVVHPSSHDFEAGLALLGAHTAMLREAEG